MRTPAGVSVDSVDIDPVKFETRCVGVPEMNINLKDNGAGAMAIEESAVRSVVELAIQDIGDDATKVNRRFLLGSAIRVKESKDKKVIVDLELNMPYYVFLPDAVREVQGSVKAALSDNLGITNAVVNVTVTKIAPPNAPLTGLAAADSAVSKAMAAGVGVTRAAAAKIAEADSAVSKAVTAGVDATKAAAARVAEAGSAVTKTPEKTS